MGPYQKILKPARSAPPPRRSTQRERLPHAKPLLINFLIFITLWLSTRTRRPCISVHFFPPVPSGRTVRHHHHHYPARHCQYVGASCRLASLTERSQAQQLKNAQKTPQFTVAYLM
ncbi:hypothetical protein CRV24_006804 [Beauveria bassiana]|nr:hypothetical protein CRV24_006804 [Beauveria bassiana]